MTVPEKASILMVCFTFPPRFGGAVVQALRLGAQLQTRDYPIAFLTDSGSGPDSQASYESFEVYRRSSWSDSSRNWRKMLWALRIVGFALRYPAFRVFHFHSVQGPELFCMPALKALGRKSVVKLTLAESDDPLTLKNRKLMGPLYGVCLHFVDKFVAISPRLQQMALQASIPQAKVSLVANGVDTGKYYFANSDEVARLRRKLDIPLAAKVIVSVGAIEHRKGYDTLLSAFLLVKRQLSEAVLLIAGPEDDQNNPYFVSLVKFIQDNQISDVRFLGKRDDVHDLMKAADLFAFCSRQEGFGTVIVEAMCCGLGVAVTDIEGITRWIIGERDLARNCESRDPAVFAHECVELLGRRNENLAKLAASSAANVFGIESVADTYEEIYAAI